MTARSAGGYDIRMDIQPLSTVMIQQTVALSVQKMAMNGAETQGAALVKMIDETIAIADPERAARVDVTA